MEYKLEKLFPVPLGIFQLDDKDCLKHLFSNLTDNIYSSDLSEYENYAKREEVTTDHDAYQIKISTKGNEAFWSNEWWNISARYDLLSSILKISDTYRKICYTHIYEIEKPIAENFVKDFWMVELKENNYNSIHVHPNATFSGIYYQSLPNAIKNNKTSQQNGNVYFVNDMVKGVLNDSFGGSQIYQVTPNEGLLLIFPSWLSHYVVPFKGPGKRISYAFNIISTY